MKRIGRSYAIPLPDEQMRLVRPPPEGEVETAGRTAVRPYK